MSRVLVIRGGAVGDFIVTMPALRLLRQNLPQARLEVMGHPGIASLAVKAGLADAVRSIGDIRLARLFARGADIDPALAEELRSFSIIISHLYDPDGILRDQMTKAGVQTLIQAPHQVFSGQGHASVQLARPLERLAMLLEDSDWRAPLFPASEKTSGPTKRVAIHPGSGSLSKNWPVDRWLRLAEELRASDPALEIIFISGEAEQERCTLPAGLTFTHWQGLSLMELADRLGTCQLFMGHDSGISHLASACGVPSLLLFGPTDPATWAPPQSCVRVLRAPGGAMVSLTYEAVRDTAADLLR